MSLDPKSLQYATTHEWAHLEDGPGGGQVATVGLSDFAIHELTDLVHIDLPEPGRKVQAGKPFGEVESVKAVSDLYSPVDGEVVEVNKSVAEHLEVLNDDPYGKGWLVKIRVQGGHSELLDYAAYKKQCDEAAE
jgi:glycine cleavage system H protein